MFKILLVILGIFAAAMAAPAPAPAPAPRPVVSPAVLTYSAPLTYSSYGVAVPFGGYSSYALPTAYSYHAAPYVYY